MPAQPYLLPRFCRLRFRIDRRRRASGRRPALEYPPLTSKQPFEIYTMLLGEFSDLGMFELQDRFDLFVGKITRSAMSLMRWRIAS